MNNLRICLYGGPGVGKSTLAANVFARLKQLNVSVELVTEYVKSWAYEKRELDLFDQVYIFAKQQRLEDRVLRAGVKLIVSDSPLYLQCVYAKKHNHLAWQELIGIAHKFDLVYPSLNILIKRHGKPYNPEGRYQTLDEAKKIDQEIEDFLNEYNIPYLTCENDVQEVVLMILHTVKELGIK